MSRRVAHMIGPALLLVPLLNCGGPVAPDRLGSADGAAAIDAALNRTCVRISVADSVLRVGDSTNVTVLRTAAAERGMTSRQTPVVRVRDSRVLSLVGSQARALAAGTTYVVATDAGCSDSVSVRVRAPGDSGATPASAPRAGFFVAPNGKPLHAANGSFEQPWDLATALAHPGRVAPGDTIWLRAGEYAGEFRSTLSGSPQSPIIVRALPGERATIVGSLMVRGSNTWYWGLEVTSHPQTRTSAVPGSTPVGVQGLGHGMQVEGANIKLIHLNIHDVAGGIFAGNLAEGLEVYGSLIYNNGWIGPDRAHGHNLYMQNRGPSRKQIHDNVLFGSFENNLHIYGSGAASLVGFDVTGNALLFSGEPAQFAPSNNVVFWGGASGQLGDATFRDNSFFSHVNGASVFKVGTAGQNRGRGVIYERNVSHGSVEFMEWSGFTIRRNVFASNFGNGAESWLLQMRILPDTPFPSHDVDDNRYVARFASRRFPLYLTGVSTPFIGDLTGWRSTTGYDRNSEFTAAAETPLPTSVRRSRFDSNRSVVTHWDLQRSGTARLSLQGIVPMGARFVVRSALDPYGVPLASGTNNGQLIQLPTTLTPVAPRAVAPRPLTTGGLIAVYVVESFGE